MRTTAKKRQLNIIIMLVAVVVLLVAFVLIKKSNGEEEVTTTNESYPVTTLKSGQIDTITYEYKDGAYASYKYTDGTWYNADDMQFPLSSNAFEKQFVEVFVGLQADKKITEYEGGLEALGLTEPELTITVKGYNGKEDVYKLGNYNKTLDRYYLMINEDEENIYMVNEQMIYICRDDIYDFATVDEFPKFSTTNLTSIQFVSGNMTYKLNYSEEGFEDDVTGYFWEWAFTEPFTNLMPCESSKMETFQEEFFDVVEYSKTVEYDATEQELAEYGLDNPKGSYTIYFTQEDEEGNVHDCSVSVYIGNVSETEQGYYTREVERVGIEQKASNVVRVLSSTYAEEILGINPLEYTLTNVLYLEIDDIEGTYITFNNGSEEFTYTYSDGESSETMSDDIYKLGEAVVDSEGFKSLWTEMISLEPERVITDKSKISTSEPAYTIFADRNVDDYYGDMTIKFIKYDSTYYQLEINGITELLIRKTKVDDFFANMTEYSQQYK